MDNGEGEAFVRLSVLADDFPEKAEVFSVKLFGPEGGAGLGPRNVKNLTIAPNDSPYGRFEIFPEG